MQFQAATAILPTRNVENRRTRKVYMPGIGPGRFRNSADEIVEEKNRTGNWPVFDHYDLHGQPGSRYLWAPRAKEDGGLNESWYLDALSRGNAGLFLEFSNWPAERKMDKATETFSGLTPVLDTERNAEAAKEWAENYGVLGLGTNLHEEHAIGGSSSLSLTTAEYTGARNLGHGLRRAYRNSPRGGKHETVEAFAFEVWQAHLARRLYEMASRKVLDEEPIVRLMDDTPSGLSGLNPAREPWSERKMWSERPWLIRRWALGIVEEAVMLKVENSCYPTVEGSPGEYQQGWGSKSLLGAMWLQMMWLMLGERNHCRWCGTLFQQTRRDKRFCNNGGKCRAAWNYHEGEGKSSKRGKALKYKHRS